MTIGQKALLFSVDGKFLGEVKMVGEINPLLIKDDKIVSDCGLHPLFLFKRKVVCGIEYRWIAVSEILEWMQ